MTFVHLFQRDEVKEEADNIINASRAISHTFSTLIQPGIDFDETAEKIRKYSKVLEISFSKLIKNELEYLLKKAKEEREANSEMWLRDIENENIELFRTFGDFARWAKEHSK